VTRVTAASRAGRLQAAVTPTWQDRRIGAAITVAAAALYGLVVGWWTPRGPVTTSQAVAAITLSLVVGLGAGLVMRSRWAMLLAPVTFAAVFELVRSSTVGPLVDGIHVGSTYGILAFASGRGLHGVLALLPMLLGAALGAGAPRRIDVARQPRHWWSSAGLWRRRSGTAVGTVGLLALTAALLRPASTEPIRAANGTLAGSVAELTRVEVGGHNLAMMIRGASKTNPVLLYLAGGPGGTDIGALRRHSQALERDFLVATYDQRGAGKSSDQLDPISTLTLDRAVSDAVEVTNYLRNRFHQNKVYLVGNSWGTILGVLAAQQHPELFRAFIGAGQMVDLRETDRIYYVDTLAWARRTGNAKLVGKLTASGPPPYRNPLDYESVLNYEQKVYPYDDTVNAESASGFSTNLFVKEYSLLEQLHNLGAALDVFTVLYPQLQNIDFRTQVTQLRVPVYLVQGRYETRGRAQPAQEWFDALQAPTKQLVTFDTAGHRTLFEQPGLFADLMTQTVLPQTRVNS
jgi:proline iminopeptidase